MNTDKNIKPDNDIPAGFFPQTDVLGQELPRSTVRGSKASPGRIFFVLALVALLIIAGWYFTR